MDQYPRIKFLPTSRLVKPPCFIDFKDHEVCGRGDIVVWGLHQIPWKFSNCFCHLEGRPFELGPVDSAGCDRGKQASETAWHIRVYEELAVLRCRHLGQHFLKLGDFADTPSARYCTVFRVRVCWTLKAKSYTKERKPSRCQGHWGAHPNIFSSVLRSAMENTRTRIHVPLRWFRQCLRDSGKSGTN